MDSSGLYTIKQIVTRILRKLNAPKSEYKHFFNLVVDGYIDLRLFHAAEGVRTTKETIDTSIDAIDFPSDFIEEVSVNVPVQGFIYSLTKDSKLVNTTTGIPEVRDGEDIYRQTDYSYNTRGGVNYFGYYTVDYEKRRILFTNLREETTEVILVYKTSGLSLTASTFIPVHYYPALECYVRYQASIDKNPNLMREYERLYQIEAKKLKHLSMPSADEFKDILRRNYTQLPTRT